MKRKKNLALALGCFLLAFLIFMAHGRKREEALAGRIAPEILRFHVLANSDSPKDQQLKLEVRTLILNSIYGELGDAATLEETKKYIAEHSDSLEQTAQEYMRSRGYDYPAHMELTSCYFPTKTYGDIVFPCGTYEAARMTIGGGKGRNWWCVLYPPLCFVDSAYAVVPDSSVDILRGSLGESDFRSLMRSRLNRNSGDQTEQKPAVHVKLKVLEVLGLE